MKCEQVQRLLPLWVGRDLTDADEAEALQSHVTNCAVCRDRQRRLQSCLDILQSVSTAAVESSSPLAHRTSLLPRIMSSLPEWPRTRDRFNGWIPAVAMTLAATLMIVVSISTIQRDVGVQQPFAWRFGTSSPSDGRNLFRTDAHFAPGVIHEDVPDHLLMPASNPIDAMQFEW